MKGKSICSSEYWESRFMKEGIMWQFEPSDSAIATLHLFKKENINNILIPGFGYGRNGFLFLQNGFHVTGIEISASAIKLAHENGINCFIHHGSVSSMPYDNKRYGGIFCYALIHLLNKKERRNFLKACFDQLKTGGIMVFTLATVQNSLYGQGKFISRNRFEISKGLNAYFYDSHAIETEFSPYGIIDCHDILEPVKFMEGNETIALKYVACRKRAL